MNKSVEKPNPGRKIAEKIRKLKDFKDYKYDEMIKDAQEIAKYLSSGGARSSQLRKFHSHLSRLWEKYKMRQKEEGDFEDIKNGLRMLKPMMSYVVARSDSRLPKNSDHSPRDSYAALKAVIDEAVDKVASGDLGENMKVFKDFYDAIIAYFVYEENVNKNNKGNRKNR